MATEEEVQKLRMEVEGERELRKLVTQQDQAERLMKKLIDRFEEGKISQQDYAKRAEIVAAHMLRLREKTEEVEKSLGKLGGAFGKYGQEMRTLGYAAQDFAQGGFGAILNNIDGLLYKFPMLAGAATIAATAIWALGPPIKQFVEGLLAGSNQIPETVDRLKRLNEQTAKNADRLRELTAKQKLTNEELAEWNRLTAEQTSLEKQANDERERRNALEAARSREDKLNHPMAGEMGEKAAAAMREMGGVDQVISDLAAQFSASAEKRLRHEELELREKLGKAMESGNGSAQGYYESLLSDLAGKRAKARENAQVDAETYVADASKGDEEAIRRLAEFFPNRGFEAATPQGLKDAAQAKADAERRRAFNEEQARRKAGNFLYGLISPAATALKTDREEQQAASENTRGIASQMDAAYKDKLASEKQAAQQAAEAPKRARDAQLQEIAGRINVDTGGQLPEAQLMDAARSTQALMERGVDPMVAAQVALSEVARANEQLQQQMAALQAGFNSIAEHQRAMRMQNSQMMGGQMGGRGYSQLPMYVGGM